MKQVHIGVGRLKLEVQNYRNKNKEETNKFIGDSYYYQVGNSPPPTKEKDPSFKPKESARTTPNHESAARTTPSLVSPEKNLYLRTQENTKHSTAGVFSQHDKYDNHYRSYKKITTVKSIRNINEELNKKEEKTEATSST